MRNSPIGYIVWLAIMCLAAVGITVGIFCLLVPVPSREAPFYFAVSLLCAAELVGFAWLANYRLSRHFRIRVGGATQITIHFLIVVYFVLTLVFALVLAPSAEDSRRFFNGVTLAYAAFVFILLFGAGMLYAKDINLRGEAAEIRGESRGLKVMQVDVERLCGALRESASANPGDAARVERVVKKIEALRTSLEYAPGGKPGTLEEESERSVSDVNEKIAGQLNELMQGAAAAGGGERLADKLDAIESVVNNIEMLLKERQQQLLV